MGANSDEQNRQLFIGGLNFQTTNKSLEDFFGQWGEVEAAVVKKYPQTKQSRGFGFVTYSQSYMVDQAMSNMPHKIDGHDVEIKRCITRKIINKPVNGKGIFISGINDQSEKDLLLHFGQFGNINNVKIIKNSVQSKAYGFVNYYETDSVYKALKNRTHLVAGKELKVNEAFKRNDSAGGDQSDSNGNMQRGISQNKIMERYYDRPTDVDFKNYSNGKSGSNTDTLKYYGTPQTWSSNYPEYVNQGGGSYSWHTSEQPNYNNQSYSGCGQNKSYYTSNNHDTFYSNSGTRNKDISHSPLYITGQQFIDKYSSNFINK
ncbi:heterogeneous nuclear ribonucleoprotein A1, A2/B1 homolog [Rhopalosiphum maidis]|uniref:heterogeneous nuclear ribonucleoprotein A1, A2/B1 homolog n=1 Tax=Rhopalosiphum maidis TaxID=43146 RepID=UPI000EFE86DA|nr:heterogeneous nuclear ribonucleoprotein A1, A2/B1 homolog [Rhopalosiphum maidis]